MVVMCQITRPRGNGYGAQQRQAEPRPDRLPDKAGPVDPGRERREAECSLPHCEAEGFHVLTTASLQSCQCVQTSFFLPADCRLLLPQTRLG